MCHGQVFPLNFVIWKNWQTFPKIRKLLNFVLENLFIRKFPKFFFSKKDKICQDKEITARGGYGKSLLLNPANYTSNL
jgi:hypothetical protein